MMATPDVSTAAPLRFDALSADMAGMLFGEGRHAVPLPLRKLPGARLLWLNRRAMQSDPAFARLNGDPGAYGRHLLDTCAYVTDDADPLMPDATGYADRYGGAGIGRNGGSGRAAVIGGYHVKGIGRTPLIGAQTDRAHASGGAYLEECVRETIHAEVLAMEFPHGAIPTLAIIDTGLRQYWRDDPHKPYERRVLMVRPCMLRPAHFERAPDFESANPAEGMLDMERVRHMYATAAAGCGAEPLRAAFQAFPLRWATQLAYAYAHRLSVGGHSTSNICLDGQMLDFGACSALPSWASITMLPGASPAGAEFQALAQAVQSLAYYSARCLARSLPDGAAIQSALEQAWHQHQHTLACEVLRLCGVPRRLAVNAMHGEHASALRMVIGRLFGHWAREQFDIMEFTPSPRIAWDLPEVWLPAPPRHLAALRALLEQIAIPLTTAQLHARSRQISSPRPSLYREELKHRLFPRVERHGWTPAEEADALAALIAAEVARARRDTHCPAVEAVCGEGAMLPAGFATSADASLVLLRCTASAGLYAAAEWLAPSLRQPWRHAAALTPGHGALLPVTVLADGSGLAVGHDASLTVTCALALHDRPDMHQGATAAATA